MQYEVPSIEVRYLIISTEIDGNVMFKLPLINNQTIDFF